MRSWFAGALLVVIVHTTALAQASDQRLLIEGPFSYLPDAELGARVDFVNEVDTTYCYPLLVSGTVVAWLANVYSFDGRLLVQRCVEYDPRVGQSPGARHGGLLDWWDVATLSPERDVLLTTRLRLPNWSGFSSPTFCAGSVAYWGMRSMELVPIIYNLRLGSTIASVSLGEVVMETDDTGHLPRPKWAPGCGAATFDGSPVDRPEIILTVKP